MKLRSIALGLATFAGSVAALAAGAIALGRRRPDAPEGQAEPGHQPLMQEPAPNGPTAHDAPPPTGLEGHAAPDLAADASGGRAPEAFRPNIDAPMTPAEREALRPATGPSPSLVSDEGGSAQGVGGDRY